MTTIRITKQFTFEMAHSLTDYDGLCKNIHGHSYHLDVTVIGEPIRDTTSPKLGMIIDFGDLKNIVHKEIIGQLDHALLLNEKSDRELISILKKHYEKIVLLPYQPTTENLLEDMALRIRKKLPVEVQLFSLRLRETDRSFAEWFASDND